MTWVKKRQLVNYDGKTAVKIGGNEGSIFESEIKKFPNDYSFSFSEKLNSKVYEIHSNKLKEVVWEKGKLVNLIEREDMVKGSFFVLIETEEEVQKVESQDEQNLITDSKGKGKEMEKNHKDVVIKSNLESVENELKELKKQYNLGKINVLQFKEKLAKLERAKQEISSEYKTIDEEKPTKRNNNDDDKGGNVSSYIFGSTVFFSLLLALMIVVKQ